MYKLANGWTKESVMAQVKKYNNNNRATRYVEGRNKPMCSYKDDNGNRCAVGCFIPDGHPALNSPANASCLMTEFPELQKLMPFDNPDALIEFQRAHDNAIAGDVYNEVQFFLASQVEGA